MGVEGTAEGTGAVVGRWGGSGGHQGCGVCLWGNTGTAVRGGVGANN